MAAGDGTPPFDPQIWGKLPPELLEQVFARLPVTSLLRFRSVCRRWNQLPFDKEFVKLHAEVSSSPGFLKALRDRCCRLAVVYIEGSGKWRTLPLNFLPFHVTLEASSKITLEAAGGGLILFSEKDKSSCLEAFYVCNPITKEWRKLQRATVRTVCVNCIAVDRSTHEFKVVVTGWADQVTHEGPLIEVFDSERNCWELKGSVCNDDFWSLRGLVLLSGTLYLAIDSGDFHNSKVIALNMEKEMREVFGGLGKWWKFHCLGEYRGSLVIVGQKRGGSGIIEIRQLNKQENRDNQWVVLDRLPEERISSPVPGSIAVAGGLVCILNEDDESLDLYNLRERSWHWVDIPLERKYWFGTPPLAFLAFQASFLPLN